MQKEAKLIADQRRNLVRCEVERGEKAGDRNEHITVYIPIIRHSHIHSQEDDEQEGDLR